MCCIALYCGQVYGSKQTLAKIEMIVASSDQTILWIWWHIMSGFSHTHDHKSDNGQTPDLGISRQGLVPLDSDGCGACGQTSAQDHFTQVTPATSVVCVIDVKPCRQGCTYPTQLA